MADVLRDALLAAPQPEPTSPKDRAYLDWFYGTRRNALTAQAALSPAEEGELLGKIAHLLTGLNASTCCHTTGGYGRKDGGHCDCRETAAEVIVQLSAAPSPERGKATELPQPTDFLTVEGGNWVRWGSERPERVHAVRFANGAVFDTINGWRVLTNNGWRSP